MGKHPTDDERGVEAEEFTQLLPAPPVQEPPEERLRELRRCVMGEIGRSDLVDAVASS